MQDNVNEYWFRVLRLRDAVMCAVFMAEFQYLWLIQLKNLFKTQVAIPLFRIVCTQKAYKNSKKEMFLLNYLVLSDEEMYSSM